LFYRPGDADAYDGRDLRYQMVNPFLGLWSKKALERDFQVFGDMDSFLEHYRDALDVGAEIPSLDFAKHYLVAIHQGLCPTGGYSIRVRSVRSHGLVVTVTVDFQEPEPGDIVTMTMTTPHVFLLVPKRRGKELVFRFRSAGGSVLAERKPMYGKSAPEMGL